MKIKNIIPVILIVIGLLGPFVSCERDPEFVKGQYRYENEELTYINDLVVQWGSDELSDDVKNAVREIVTSMTFIEGGIFTMGSSGDAFFSDEQPAHRVTVSDFYIANVTVTQKQWEALMGTNILWNDNFGKGDDYPANFVSYDQALLFISRLNKCSGLKFRLPTEAEWEYAAIGGRKSKGYDYSGSDEADNVAWHRGNAGSKMHPSSQLAPNELGLYDMSGNLYEWCSDWYGDYTQANETNPIGPLMGNKRVVRGGSFTYDAEFSRCKARNRLSETNQSVAVGLRLVISANETK